MWGMGACSDFVFCGIQWTLYQTDGGVSVEYPADPRRLSDLVDILALSHQHIFSMVHRVVIMAIDWIGFGYAIVVALGGVVGYTRKGSIVSLAAGLFFGLVSGYGAYCVTHDSRDVKISFFSAFILTIVMGMRFKRSKKLIPGGLIAGLSLLMILRLVFLLL
uniref:Transmembrane protein 14A n=1 Tax=Chelydra serpentina TaxID=8475 RepID=A0A8C3RNK7_CHESE